MPPVSPLRRYPWLFALAVFVLYYLFARLGVVFSSMPDSSLSLLWLPSGIGAAAVMLRGWRMLPAIWLASLLINTPAGLPDALMSHHWAALLAGVGGGAVDTFQSFAAAWLFQRLVGRPRFVAGYQVLRFSFWVAIPVSAVTVMLLVALYAALGFLPKTPETGVMGALSIWASFSLADIHGMLLIVPLALSWMGAYRERGALNPWLMVGMFGVLAVIILLGYTVLGGAVYLLIPMFMILALRAHVRGVALFLTVSSITLTSLTVYGHSPFGGASHWAQLANLLLFVFASGVAALFVAAQQLELRSAKSMLEDQVAKRTLALREANQRLQALTRTDDLTSIPNRRHFMAATPQDNARGVVMMLDIDYFKSINDRFGHQAGDDVLRAVATLGRQQVRSNDLFARTGGEEFACWLPEMTVSEAIPVAERLRQVIADAEFEMPEKLSVTVSIGLSPFLRTLEETMTAADAALYDAKRAGRNRVVVAGSPGGEKGAP